MSDADIWAGREPKGSAGGPLIAILGVVALFVVGFVGLIAIGISSARNQAQAPEHGEEPTSSTRTASPTRKANPFFSVVYRPNLGKLETEGDWQNLASELSAKASEGDANALWQLSILYGNSYCPFREEAASLDYLRQAADQDYGPALHDLGRRHETGDGVDEDLHLALRFYERARDAGLMDGSGAVKRLRKKLDLIDAE